MLLFILCSLVVVCCALFDVGNVLFVVVRCSLLSTICLEFSVCVVVRVVLLVVVC